MQIEAARQRRETMARHWPGIRRNEMVRGAKVRRRFEARPLREPIESRRGTRQPGPYEASYDVSHGYAVERQILRP